MSGELKQFAEVSWTAEDMQVVRPDWSIEQCNYVLNRSEDALRTVMIEQGWKTLEDEAQHYEQMRKDEIRAEGARMAAMRQER